MNCDLVFQECFCEDVCSHLVGQAVLDVNVAICYGLMDKVELNVDVFGTSIIIIICGKVKGCLIITEECGGTGNGAKEWEYKPAKPNAFLCCMGCGDIFGLGSG
jgi:hypothetical protein